MDPSGPASPRALPLTMPEELWLRLAPKKREMFTDAQAILDELERALEVPIADLSELVGRPLGQLLAPLRLLRALELIEVGRGGVLRVIAIPAEPVRVRGPDGRWRWIFVKRRLAPTCDLDRIVWN